MQVFLNKSRKDTNRNLVHNPYYKVEMIPINDEEAPRGIQKVWNEAKRQFVTFSPTLCSMLLYRFPWLISLRFVSGLGEEELAAAALATTLCNVTGMSLSVGLSSALSTLCGQARGEMMEKMERKEGEEYDGQPLLKNNAYQSYESTTITSSSEESDEEENVNSSQQPTDRDDILLPMLLLYRGIFVQLLAVVPMGLWWIGGIEGFLRGLGQTEAIAEMGASYLRFLAPGLWCYSINWTVTTWLQSIEMADVPAYAAGVGLALHIPFNILFIYWLDWGYLGAAAATIVFQAVQPALILFYLFATMAGRERVLKNTVAAAVGRTCLSSRMGAEIKLAITSISGLVEYVALAIPGVISISEWWASELAIFWSGRLQPQPEIALGAMTLYQSLNSVCFMLPVASSVAGATRVSNLLGANQTKGAALAAKVSVASAMLVSGTCACILFFTPHWLFPSLFAPGESVIAETSKVIPLLSVYVFADGIQCALNGIMKACGRQCHVMPIVLVAYWVVGVPLAYYLAFVRNGGEMCNNNLCGVVGLVAGMTTGTWVHMLLLLLVVTCTTNWDREAAKAQERLTKAR